MQFRGTKVSVRRIMLIQAADIGIAEKDAAAPVGLQAALMRIDDDGVNFTDAGECRFSISGKIVNQSEVSAVRSVGVDAKPKLVAQRQDFGQGIDGAGGGGAHGGNQGADIAALQAFSQRVYIDAGLRVYRDGFKF